MATKSIDWNDGSGGKIYLTYASASGNQTVAVTSDANTGAARAMTVYFTTGNIARQLIVEQEAGGPQTHTLTVYPSSYDATNYAYASLSNINNAYASADSTTNAAINLVTGANAETYIYFKFDLSSIPSGAAITSLSLSVKLRTSTGVGTRITGRTVRVCRGTTAVGTDTTYTATTDTYTVDTGSGWTGQNIQDLTLYVWAQRGTQGTSSNYSIQFFGATLTVEYMA